MKNLGFLTTMVVSLLSFLATPLIVLWIPTGPSADTLWPGGGVAQAHTQHNPITWLQGGPVAQGQWRGLLFSWGSWEGYFYLPPDFRMSTPQVYYLNCSKRHFAT